MINNHEWMEAEAYRIKDRIYSLQNIAYKQGVRDAWEKVKTLWHKGMLSFEWNADEMMNCSEKEERKNKYRPEVEKIADAIGIHALYDIVKDMRENE